MDKYIEKLCHKALFEINQQALKDNHELIYLISKERLAEILTQAMQAQREACFEEFFAYNEENKALQKVGNLNEMRERILNAEVKK